MQEIVSVPSIRSGGNKENNKFNLESMCFLCGTVGLLESSKDACFPLRTFDSECRLCDITEKRKGEWGKTVLERMYQVADAFYRQMCNIKFKTTSRHIPLKYATLSNPKRRNSARSITA